MKGREVSETKEDLDQRGGDGIGQKLIEAGLITRQHLELALKERERTGKVLGAILTDLGFVTQEEINSIISAQRGVSFIPNLTDLNPDPEAIKLIPQSIARKYRVFPLSLEENTLTVVLLDPYDVVVQDELSRLTGKRLKVAVAKEEDILHCIDTWYAGGSISVIDDIINDAMKLVFSGQSVLGEEAPVIRLVNQLIINAIKSRATDIHIEPEEKVVLVRYRIDGRLQIILTMQKPLQQSILSRIKIMAGMDISETRIPQDGKIRFNLGARRVDLRIATFPTNWGESVAIRVLDKTQAPLNLETLGMDEHTLEKFKTIIQKPYGLILMTGPTGSGKTTTLYSALLTLNSSEKNIMTIEDPIEFELPLIHQSQINEKAGFTFSEGLKYILRHDPDIILVGEIRDKETAEMAVRSSLTGHLVFSTVHTFSAAGAIPRLIDMGIEPFLLSSAIVGVVSQRLVRKICLNCKKEYIPSDLELQVLRDAGVISDGKFSTLYKGEGCQKCMKTGYYGRTGIFEVLTVNDEISQMIVNRTTESQIYQSAIRSGMVTIRTAGLHKVIKGITTIDEVLGAF